MWNDSIHEHRLVNIIVHTISLFSISLSLSPLSVPLPSFVSLFLSLSLCHTVSRWANVFPILFTHFIYYVVWCFKDNAIIFRGKTSRKNRSFGKEKRKEKKKPSNKTSKMKWDIFHVFRSSHQKCFIIFGVVHTTCLACHGYIFKMSKVLWWCISFVKSFWAHLVYIRFCNISLLPKMLYGPSRDKMWSAWEAC